MDDGDRKRVESFLKLKKLYQSQKNPLLINSVEAKWDLKNLLQKFWMLKKGM
jgi:hypothetical protein